MVPQETTTWNILDVGSIWMKEFASALSKTARVIAWCPKIDNFGGFGRWERTESLADPKLEITTFPLQRGYTRMPLRWCMPFQHRLYKRLLAQTSAPEQNPLVCSTPFYAPVAELWRGPVLYYVTDLTMAYESLDAEQVKALDVRMCRVAQAVYPNSRRIASYLTTEAGCEASKITVLPNATRQSNLLAGPQSEPGPLPDDVRDLPRPIVAVLGDLSGNMDWELIAEAIRQTPSLSWLFVGPTKRPIVHRLQSEAREWAKAHAHFVGFKPYRELQAYARCADVAVLPYLKHEPTYSGSSTRFYEHLAAGRPMVATRGFAELLEKEPLLTLVDTAEEMAGALLELSAKEFRDGHELARWQASQLGTWEERARVMRTTYAAANRTVRDAAPGEARQPSLVRRT